jgi:hypothetical protein
MVPMETTTTATATSPTPLSTTITTGSRLEQCGLLLAMLVATALSGARCIDPFNPIKAALLNLSVGLLLALTFSSSSRADLGVTYVCYALGLQLAYLDAMSSSAEWRTTATAEQQGQGQGQGQGGGALTGASLAVSGVLAWGAAILTMLPLLSCKWFRRSCPSSPVHNRVFLLSVVVCIICVLGTSPCTAALLGWI